MSFLNFKNQLSLASEEDKIVLPKLFSSTVVQKLPDHYRNSKWSLLVPYYLKVKRMTSGIVEVFSIDMEWSGTRRAFGLLLTCYSKAAAIMGRSAFFMYLVDVMQLTFSGKLRRSLINNALKLVWFLPVGWEDVLKDIEGVNHLAILKAHRWAWVECFCSLDN